MVTVTATGNDSSYRGVRPMAGYLGLSKKEALRDLRALGFRVHGLGIWTLPSRRSPNYSGLQRHTCVKITRDPGSVGGLQMV